MKKQQWQAHIKAWKKSGLTQTAYAREHKLVYHQLLYWCRKINKTERDAFIPVKVKRQKAEKHSNTTLGVLELPNGARLVIQSQDLLTLLPTLLSE